ncbi:MAG: Alpha/beta hydrolase family protein [Tenericutes bacterium ADurb.BinA155]|nr:MAG: Alpha/beta hydrolase family protein [Tenericutes bacterium ADurb.BinA155]
MLKKSPSKKLAWLVLFVGLGALVYVSALTFFIYTGTYYLASDSAIALASDEDGAGNIRFFPKVAASTGIIFYPGAKVDERAYAPLSSKLAEAGFYVVIARMPFHLAVFQSDAAATIKAQNPTISSWYLCGHSLGGAMAASYLSDEQKNYTGLILLASYSTADLSQSALRTLTIYGSEDHVLNQSKYQNCKKNLPASNLEVKIAGGNHGQFGDYGIQQGDGTATISREEQQEETVKAIVAVCA